MVSNTVTLTIGNQKITGWKNIRVTRGIERCPNDFDIAMTEYFPAGDIQNVTVKPGDECQLKIGDDVVVTGYIDRYLPRITPTSHTIRVMGRGKCQDLVDCSAEWPGGQITGATALEIAKNIANVYGIQVIESPRSQEAKYDQLPIPTVNLILTETAWEVIERTCRFRGLLAYEQADGTLYLSRVGDASMGNGFSVGDNVQSAVAEHSMDQRYSDYRAKTVSTEAYNDLIPGFDGSKQAGVPELIRKPNPNDVWLEKDPNVPRHRLMNIIAETGDPGLGVVKMRAMWEAVRRIGRSTKVYLTTDTWRDKDGKLWEPNTYVPLNLPPLKVVTEGKGWIIGEVTYKMDDRVGTTAELLLMPPNAFIPEPILLQPFLAEFANVQIPDQPTLDLQWQKPTQSTNPVDYLKKKYGQ